MDLLFNKDGNGSAEIKELIGSSDSDLDFVDIKSDVISASKELIKIIGQPVYDAVKTVYDKAAPTSDEKDLLYAVRYPIILDAYRHSLKSSDLSHTTEGRRMRSDDFHKTPFEWMVDRDDENFERKYYKALDDMIEYLDAESSVWKESSSYSKSQKYFVRLVSDFDEYFPINSRLLLLKLQPGLRQCERKEIMPRITKTLFDDLKAKLKNDAPIQDNEKDLIELIKEACVYYSISWGFKVLRATLFPEGVLQKYTSERKTTQAKMVTAKLEAELVSQHFKEQAEDIFRDIENYSIVSDIESDPVVVENIVTPKYKFDDDDSFVTL